MEYEVVISCWMLSYDKICFLRYYGLLDIISLGPKIKNNIYIYKETRAMAVPPSCTIDCRSAIHNQFFLNVPVWVDQPRVEDREDPVSQVHE